ncbi:MAG: exodeoxyribonuclease VII large subunit, partial [Treponema sp.]|nr:exodeoxyribonuclease VII large subunit [Treponema sp.]
ALCDYAADFRAPTPSAAAEMAIPVLEDIKIELQDYKEDLYNNINRIVKNTRLLIKSFNPDSLEIKFRNIQQPLLNRFENAKINLFENIKNKIKDYRNIISNSKTILENASLQTILDRGYSMVTDKKGNVIRNETQVSAGDEIKITLAKGKLSASVN